MNFLCVVSNDWRMPIIVDDKTFEKNKVVNMLTTHFELPYSERNKASLWFFGDIFRIPFLKNAKREIRIYLSLGDIIIIVSWLIMGIMILLIYL